jgi:release factor glutamine methyltransferase
MRLYLDFERTLNDAQVQVLRDLVVRRGLREPLQHITGSASFCGLEFKVNQDVLTPRPETEILAELGWKVLQKLAETMSTPAALDFGTGSGCLAVTLAQKCPPAMITAIDISRSALRIAEMNAGAHGVQDRIRFVESDGFSAVDGVFDLIISNPPYIPHDEIPSLQPEVRKFDPTLALDGGADGLNFYRRLALEARMHLRAGGTIAMEFGDGQAPAVSEIFLSQKWIVEAPVPDYTGKPRILVAVRGANET